MNQKLTALKRKICNVNIIIEDFNILLLAINCTTKQKFNKGINDLKNAINCPDIFDIYITL